MRRFIVGFAIAAAAGAAVTAHATPAGDCAGPADAVCTDRKGTPDPKDDEMCIVFVTGVNPLVNNCYNGADVPA